MHIIDQLSPDEPLMLHTGNPQKLAFSLRQAQAAALHLKIKAFLTVYRIQVLPGRVLIVPIGTNSTAVFAERNLPTTVLQVMASIDNEPIVGTTHFPKAVIDDVEFEGLCLWLERKSLKAIRDGRGIIVS